MIILISTQLINILKNKYLKLLYLNIYNKMVSIVVIYTSLMILLGGVAINKNCKNTDKLIIHKKRFKHYRFHLINV
jgi:hypothetical protein